MATEEPIVGLEPPARLDHMKPPSVESLSRKRSCGLVLVNGPPPKSTVPSIVPVTTMALLFGSIAIPKPDSVTKVLTLALPNRFDQRWAPAEEYFATKIS